MLDLPSVVLGFVIAPEPSSELSNMFNYVDDKMRTDEVLDTVYVYYRFDSLGCYPLMN